MENLGLKGIIKEMTNSVSGINKLDKTKKKSKKA